MVNIKRDDINNDCTIDYYNNNVSTETAIWRTGLRFGNDNYFIRNKQTEDLVLQIDVDTNITTFNHNVRSSAEPTNNNDLVNKNYVDNAFVNSSTTTVTNGFYTVWEQGNKISHSSIGRANAGTVGEDSNYKMFYEDDYLTIGLTEVSSTAWQPSYRYKIEPTSAVRNWMQSQETGGISSRSYTQSGFNTTTAYRFRSRNNDGITGAGAGDAAIVPSLNTTTNCTTTWSDGTNFRSYSVQYLMVNPQSNTSSVSVRVECTFYEP